MRPLAKSATGSGGGRAIVNADQGRRPQLVGASQQHSFPYIVNVPRSLPPGVDGDQVLGKLELTVGALEWLNYDGSNYLADSAKGKQHPLAAETFVNASFWGEEMNNNGGKGVYLHFAGYGGNTFTYDIKCPEKSFEAYLDDMGALMIDLYDANTGYTIGAASIQLSLYVKRAKRPNDPAPLLEMRDALISVGLTGDYAVRIGEFKLTAVAQF